MKLHETTWHLAAIALLATLSAAAEVQEPTKPELTDHLVPTTLNLNDPSAPDFVRFQSELGLKKSFFARAIFMPAFFRRSCLQLHGAEGESDITKAKTFTLTCYEESYRTLKSSFGAFVQGEEVEVKASAKSVDLSEPCAKRLPSVWDQMLARTGPAELGPDAVFDGFMAQFDVPGKSGTTPNPRGGESVDLFLGLVSRLKDYCKLPPEHRPGFMVAVEDQVTKLENYLKDHPAK